MKINQNMNFRFCCITLIFFFICNITLSGQNPICSRLTPEEVGYVNELYPIIAEIYWSDKETRFKFDEKYRTLPFDEIFKDCVTLGNYGLVYGSNKTFFSKTNFWSGPTARSLNEIVYNLKEIIPPSIFHDFHIKAIELVEEKIKEKELKSKLAKRNLTRESLENIKSEISDFDLQLNIKYLLARSLLKKTEKIIRKRNKFQLYDNDELMISFKPPIVPVKLGMTNEGDLSFSLDNEIETPFGDIGFNSDIQGRNKIIIVHKHKRKILVIDRQFKIFIPTNYGINLISKKENELIVEVIDK